MDPALAQASPLACTQRCSIYDPNVLLARCHTLRQTRIPRQQQPFTPHHPPIPPARAPSRRRQQEAAGGGAKRYACDEAWWHAIGVGEGGVYSFGYVNAVMITRGPIVLCAFCARRRDKVRQGNHDLTPSPAISHTRGSITEQLSVFVNRIKRFAVEGVLGP